MSGSAALGLGHKPTARETPAPPPAMALEEPTRRGPARSTLHQILRAFTLHAHGHEADARQEWQAVYLEEAGYDRAREALLFEAQVRFLLQGVIR